MNPTLLQLLLIMLASALLGAVLTFSFYHATDSRLVLGSMVFSGALLMILIIQLREIRAEQ